MVSVLGGLREWPWPPSKCSCVTVAKAYKRDARVGLDAICQERAQRDIKGSDHGGSVCVLHSPQTLLPATQSRPT